MLLVFIYLFFFDFVFYLEVGGFLNWNFLNVCVCVCIYIYLIEISFCRNFLFNLILFSFFFVHFFFWSSSCVFVSNLLLCVTINNIDLGCCCSCRKILCVLNTKKQKQKTIVSYFLRRYAWKVNFLLLPESKSITVK